MRRLRNLKGLRPYQLAQAEGHYALARLLAETRPYVPQHLSSRRARRAAHEPAQRHMPTPEAILAMLAGRARLMLSLRAVTLQQPDTQGSVSISRKSIGGVLFYLQGPRKVYFAFDVRDGEWPCWEGRQA